MTKKLARKPAKKTARKPVRLLMKKADPLTEVAATPVQEVVVVVPEPPKQVVIAPEIPPAAVVVREPTPPYLLSLSVFIDANSDEEAVAKSRAVMDTLGITPPADPHDPLASKLDALTTDGIPWRPPRRVPLV